MPKQIHKNKPHADATVEATFPQLRMTDEVVRWRLPDDPATQAHVGHVFTDAGGTRLVVDASSPLEWHAYQLAEVLVIGDDNQPLKK